MTSEIALTARFATPGECTPAQWNKLVAANPAGGDFLQAHAYARLKQKWGWRTRFLVFARADEVVSVSLVLEARFPFFGRYWYLPHGPAVTTADETREHVAALREFVGDCARDVFAVTIEPQIREDFASPLQKERCAAALGPGAIWRPGIHVNTNTAIVDIERDEDTLMASFDPKCRNKIRRGIKDGCKVYYPTPDQETYSTMHRLMRLVRGGKANLVLRNNAYQEEFWDAFTADGLGRFYAVNGDDGKPAVMAYTIRVGSRAFYKDGGSERPRTSPGMANLMQWHMMLRAKEEGATEYDMVGTTPRAQIDDESHINYSLGKFKLSFAREITEYVGGYDIPFSRGRYSLWSRLLLPLRLRFYRLKYKDYSWF